MKRVFAIAIMVILIFTVVACNPSQQALWDKNKATGFGGLVRHIQIIDEITGKVIYDKTGKAFIADGSTASDVAILWIGADGKNRKDDILGSHFILIAEEQ